MSGLSTKDVQVGGGLPKTIVPGIQVLKINAVRLASFPFMEKDNGLFLILDVESKPIPDFEGFFIDKDNESLGRYAGQIGQVKTNRFYYKDGTTKSGIEISRDMEILKQIKNICIATDCLAWFDKADGKFNTVEDLVAAFSKAAPFKEKYLRMCVAGKEFERDNGYIGYDLFLPKLEKGKVAYELETVKLSKILPFDESKHLIKVEAKSTTSFGEETNLPTGEIPVNDDPELAGAPEFEL